MSPRFVFAAGAVCALSACSVSHKQPSTSQASEVPVALVATPNTLPDATDTTTPVSITLDGKGLRFASSDNGSISLLAFGVPRTMADAAVSAVLGKPNAQDSNDECPAGKLDFSTYGPLSLNFKDGKFVGWGVFPSGSNEAPGFATVGGVQIGMSRQALEKLHKLTFPTVSSLPEFSFGAIHGKFGTAQPPQTVAALWAGTNCIFR